MAQTGTSTSTSAKHERPSRAGLAVFVIAMAAVLVMAWYVLLGGRGTVNPSELPRIKVEGEDPLIVQLVEETIEQVQENPSSAEAWGKLGMVYHSHGFEQQALQAYEKASSLDTKDGRWLYLTADVLADDDPEKSLTLLRQSVDLMGDRYPTALVRLAVALVERGELDQAEQLAKRALAKQPQYGRALQTLGQVQLAKGDVQQARTLLEQAIRHEPDSHQAHILLAQVYQSSGEADRATPLVARAELLDQHALVRDELVDEIHKMRTGEIAWVDRADVWMREGKFDLARQLLEAIVKDYPQSHRGWMNLGMVYQIVGNLRASDAAFKRAREIKPDQDNLMLMHSYTLLRIGQVENAQKIIREILTRKPDYAEALVVQGMIEHRNRDYLRSVATLRRAVELRPDHPNAHASLAKVLLDLEQPDEAERAAQEALRLQPDNPTARSVIQSVRSAAPKPNG